MQNLLNQYFPMIRSMEAIASEIQKSEVLTRIFNEWSPEKRMHFVDICTGRCGVKMLYEPFWQDLITHSIVRKTMEAWLGNLAGQELKLKDLSMPESKDNILLECNVESRRIGNLRRVRFVQMEAASLGHETIQEQENAYRVIVLEDSPEDLQLYQKEYMYYGRQQNKAGSEAAAPESVLSRYSEEYCIFCLEQFNRYIRQNGIQNTMDAWWVFCVCEDPEFIEQVVTKYPTFAEIYGKLYDILSDPVRTIQLMQGSRLLTDCGAKCIWLIRLEKMLEEQRKQNIYLEEKIASMQKQIRK